MPCSWYRLRVNSKASLISSYKPSDYERISRVDPFFLLISGVVSIETRQRNGPFYQVPTGRRDGRVSKISHAINLPEVSDPIQLLKSKFRQKGFSDRDLVLLSGILYTHTSLPRVIPNLCNHFC